VQRAEPPLLVERVDLDDDAVDLVVELDAAFLPLSAGLRDFLDRLQPLHEGVGGEAALAQPLERLPLRAEVEALPMTRAVHPDGERPLGRDVGVELPE